MSCKKLSHLLWLKGVNLETGAQPTMTKAELVEEVTQLGDLTRRDGEVIVDTIFDAVIGALKSGDKIEIVDLAASASGSGSRVSGAIRRRELKWRFLPSACLTSSPARNCAIWSILTRRKQSPPLRRSSREEQSRTINQESASGRIPITDSMRPVDPRSAR